MTRYGRVVIPAWDRLVPKISEMEDLASALRLMHWDQLVMMPGRGAQARARGIATVQTLLHERLIDPEVGALLDELRNDESLDDERKAHVRVLAREHFNAVKVPPELVRELGELEGLSYHAWTQARPASDFSLLQPHLARMVELKKQEADALGWEDERYDALLDQYEPEMRTGEVEAMFGELTGGLKPVIEQVLPEAGTPPEFLSQSYEPARQEAFCRTLVERLGFDFEGGRLDTSPHPFTSRIQPGDVRQTTRADPKDLLMSIYAVLHETGHALYEQGIPERLHHLPAGHVPSLGMHESQSRLWENHVGRSRSFSDFLLRQLKEQWPGEVGMASPEEFYRGVNLPRRSLIRVTADELTYNLHVALRFELEAALFRDELEVGDLPDAWDAGMEKHVGVRPANHAEGVLQDMHWSLGSFGYFPTYTLGTLYAAAFFSKAQEELGDLDDDFKRGETTRLLGWLRVNLHQHAYLYPAKELGGRVLGGPLDAQPFLSYVRDKFCSLFSN